MGSKKLIAVLVAVLMLTVCVLPMIGDRNVSARDDGFIDGIVDDGIAYTEIYSEEDLTEIAPGSNYILTRDLDFTGKNYNGGFPIKIDVSVSGDNLTVELSAEGKNLTSLKAYLNATPSTVENGRHTFTYDKDKIYALTISGVVDSNDVNIGLVIGKNTTTLSVTKDSNGNMDPIAGFDMIFNGNGYTIKGLDITSNSDSALFVTPVAGATIKNLRLEDGIFTSANMNGDTTSGSIVANGGDVNIFNCFAYSCDVISIGEKTEAGGIATKTYNVESCISAYGYVIASSADTSGSVTLGGIVSSTPKGVSRSYSTSTLVCEGKSDIYFGGVLGLAESGAEITSCFSTYGSFFVTNGGAEEAYVGGVVGKIFESQVKNCYSTITSMTVSGKAAFGGIVGASEKGIIETSISTCTLPIGNDLTKGYIAGKNSATNPGTDKSEIRLCYYQIPQGVETKDLDKYPLTGDGTDESNYWKMDDGITFDSSDDQRRSGPKTTPQSNTDDKEYLNNDIKNQGTYYTVGVDSWDFKNIWGMNQRYDAPDSSTGYQINNGYPVLQGMFPHEIYVDDMKDQLALKGDKVTFTVKAYSDVPLTYAWHYSTNGSTWESMSETTASITVDAGDKTTQYRCTVKNGTASNLYATAELTISNPEIRTAEDLKNMLPNGKYIQKADIDLTDVDLNGGLDVTAKAEIIGTELKVTVTYKDGDKVYDATNVYVTYNGAVEKTGAADGVIKNNFTYDPAVNTIVVGGVISKAENFAMMFDISGDVTEFTKNSNGNFTPIGSATDPFTGEFNGNGYTIKGIETVAYSEAPLPYIRDGKSDVYALSGLFGYVKGGTVKNVAIESGSSMAVAAAVNNYNIYANAGGVVGCLNEGTVEGCYNKGSVISISMDREGVALDDYADAGGIAGSSYRSNINDSFNTGSIRSIGIVEGDPTGGIVGYSENSYISNCYNTGTTSSKTAGGIVGCAGDVGLPSMEYITNCYFLDSSASKLIGWDNGSNTTIDGGNAWTDGTASGSKTAEQLKDKNAFHSADTTVGGKTIKGWDFSSKWKMGSDGPILIEAGQGGNDDDGDGDIDPILIAVIIAAIAIVIIAAVILWKRRG